MRRNYLTDQVLPAALSDPRLQATRDKRWAKKTAGGSLALIAFCGVVFDLFQPNRATAVAEQEQNETAAGMAMEVTDPGEGGKRFVGKVRLR